MDDLEWRKAVEAEIVRLLRERETYCSRGAAWDISRVSNEIERLERSLKRDNWTRMVPEKSNRTWKGTI